MSDNPPPALTFPPTPPPAAPADGAVAASTATAVPETPPVVADAPPVAPTAAPITAMVSYANLEPGTLAEPAKIATPQPTFESAEPPFPAHIRFEIGAAQEVESWVKAWVEWKIDQVRNSH